MMAIANYVVLKDFTYKDQAYEISQELMLPDNIGERYVRQGILQVVTFLEPGTDDAEIAVVDAETAEDHDQASSAEASRDAAKSAQLIEGDPSAEVPGP